MLNFAMLIRTHGNSRQCCTKPTPNAHQESSLVQQRGKDCTRIEPKKKVYPLSGVELLIM